MTADGTAWAGERVPERTVVTHWLAVEAGKRTDAGPESGTGTGDTHDDPSTDAVDDPRETTLDDGEALDALLRRKPGAAAFVWRARPVEWSRITLRRAEFERLRFVDGPDGLGWRALAPTGTVIEGARRIATDDLAALDAGTGIDVERVRSMAGALADGDRLGPLVLAKRRGYGPPAVADGNHRATAIALHLLRTGEYRPQRAYLGIGANPVLRPLCRRVRGALARLRPGNTRW